MHEFAGRRAIEGRIFLQSKSLTCQLEGALEVNFNQNGQKTAETINLKFTTKQNSAGHLEAKNCSALALEKTAKFLSNIMM